LDTIERGLQALEQAHPPPLIHLKAQFFEARTGTLREFSQYWNLNNQDITQPAGILTSKATALFTQGLQSRNDIEALGEPDASAASGRQIQMYADSHSFPQIGPKLDIVPYVLADGYTVNLSVIPSQTNRYASNQSPAVLPKVVVTTANVWDNQTLLVGMPEVIDDNNLGQAGLVAGKELLILVTATIVDPAGKRVHSDEQLPFAMKGFPAQPDPNHNALKNTGDYPDTIPVIPQGVTPRGGRTLP
jgi:hypothetical protein